MRMHNPPHPGEILSELWLDPLGLSPAETAAKLKMPGHALSAIVAGQAPIDPETALRLELAFGKVPNHGWHTKPRSTYGNLKVLADI